MPFYHLTDKGLLVALSLEEVQNRDKILDQIISKSGNEEKENFIIIQKLILIAPTFGYSFFKRYIKSFCNGEIPDLLPFTISNLKESADNSTKIQIEFLEGFSRLQKTEREITINFLKKIE